MINFPDIHEEWYEFYDPDGNYIDRIEDYIQWLEILVQIKNQELSGYYMMSKDGIKIDIDSKGQWDYSKRDPYKIVTDLLMKLI